MSLGRASAACCGLIAALVALVACDAPTPPPPPSCDELGSVESAASPVDRHLLGEAAPYPADGTLTARRDELVRSQRARREAAWEVVARVLAPVALAEPTPVSDATVPAFRTWYDQEDFGRIFRSAYEGIGRDRRMARAPFTESELDAAFGWNVALLGTLDTWTPERLAEYVDAVASPVHVAGLGGIRRIAMSPDATRHLVASYAQVMQCVLEGAPPAFIGAPGESTQRLAREALLLSRCSAHTSGPYFVASDAELSARVEGALAADATLRVSEGAWAASAIERCAASGDEGCVVAGPGIFFVEVVSGAEGLEGMLDVEHTAPMPEASGCLSGPFPLASATVAMEWRRADFGWTMPTFDTSSDAIAARLAGDATWGEGEAERDPDERSVYTMVLPNGNRFRLAAMHIRTREVDHWMNITIWWSDDPESDFGADRSASVRALGGPWSSYKMCVAMDFLEGDEDPSGGFATSHPSLGDALAVVHEGVGGPTWCSNPFIDGAPGLVRSNCVGCHQQAMSGAHPSEVVLDEMRFPATGRVQTRDNFPADGFWGLDGGDDLASTIRETLTWWDAADAM